jgi:hypothetical protein
LSVDGDETVSHTFSDALSDGTIGVGTRNALASFDDFDVSPYDPMVAAVAAAVAAEPDNRFVERNRSFQRHLDHILADLTSQATSASQAAPRSISSRSRAGVLRTRVGLPEAPWTPTRVQHLGPVSSDIAVGGKRV